MSIPYWGEYPLVHHFWKDIRQHLSTSIMTARRSNQSILVEINPEYSLEGLMLKLKLQYFGHLIWRADSGKDPGAGKDWRQRRRGWQRIRWLDSITDSTHMNSGKLWETGRGQGRLVCCRPWGHRVRCDLVAEQQKSTCMHLCSDNSFSRNFFSEIPTHVHKDMCTSMFALTR